MDIQVNQLHDSAISTVWKLVYWILGLFFLGFGFLAILGGSEWWGAFFIINGFLYIYSSSSLNRKSKKLLDREITYLVLVLFFSFLGFFLIIGLKLWWGVFSFIIMTAFSVLSVTLNEENKVPPVLKNLFTKTNSKVIYGHTENKLAKNQNSTSIFDIISQNPLISTIIGGLIVSIIMLIIQKILFKSILF